MDIVNQGGMTITALSPAQFRKAYGDILASNGDKMSERKMSQLLGISRNTLRTYLANPEYAPTVQEIKPVLHNAEVKHHNHSEKIIEVAYKLHEKGITEAMNAKKWKEARKIALDALKIARVDAEIKRIFLVIAGDVNINETTNIQINVQNEINKIYPKLCEKCRKAVRE